MNDAGMGQMKALVTELTNLLSGEPLDPELMTAKDRAKFRAIRNDLAGTIRKVENLLKEASEINRRIIETGLCKHLKLITADDQPSIMVNTTGIAGLRNAVTYLDNLLGEDG